MRAAILASNPSSFACADDGSDARTNAGAGGTTSAEIITKNPLSDVNKPGALDELRAEFAKQIAAFGADIDTRLETFSAGWRTHLDTIADNMDQRMKALEDGPHNDAAAGHPRYEELRALVMETRGHVDNLSRDVSALRRS